MRSRTIEIPGTFLLASPFVRTCACCRLPIENQFLTRCPRCTHPMPLANVCTGCMKRCGCQSE